MFFELAGITSDPPIFLDFALKKHSPPLCAGGLVGWVGWVAGLAGLAGCLLAGWLVGWWLVGWLAGKGKGKEIGFDKLHTPGPRDT